MFSVKIYKFVNDKTNKNVLKAKENYKIPGELDSYISFIDGISNPLFSVYDPYISSNDPDTGYVGREVIGRLYGIDQSLKVLNNVSAAAIEFQGGGFSNNDLRQTQVNNNVNPRNVYKVIGGNAGGGTSSSASSATGTAIALYFATRAAAATGSFMFCITR